MDDTLELLGLILVIVLVVLLIRGMRKAKQNNTAEQAATQTTQTSSTLVDGDKQQIVDDIRSTQTSRVVDQVAILEDLGQTTQNYRQFCELSGVTQSSGGVTAPYSKRQVAYYDVRCYKIERVNGREIETLVAQERSFDPFYFTDSSCDTKVYVSLDSFGKNIILVNSMNHIEGPTSDFSKAISNRTASLSGTEAAKLMVANTTRGLHEGLRNVWNWTVLAPEKARTAMDAAFGFMGVSMQPAFAGAQSWGGMSVGDPLPSNYHLAAKPGGSGKPSQGGFSGKPSSSQHPIGGGKPTSSQHPIGSSNQQHHASSANLGSPKPPQQNVTTVNLGSGKIPAGLDTFLGLGGTGLGGLQQNPSLGGPMSPYYTGYGSGKTGDLGSALLSIGLSALLSSMSNSGSGSSHTSSHAPTQTPAQTTAPVSTYTQTNNTFMGYRIVEDVVPLNYPVYCLGDLYKNGKEVYMGKAMGKVSQSYYFATKLETEVLEHLQKP